MPLPSVTFKNGKRYWFRFQSMDSLEPTAGYYTDGSYDDSSFPKGLKRDPRTGDIYGVPNDTPGTFFVQLYQDKRYTQVVQPA